MTDGAPNATPLLVGRQRELDSLWDQFKQSATGRLRIALVADEPAGSHARCCERI